MKLVKKLLKLFARPVKSSTSDAHLMVNTRWEQLGLELIDDVLHVLLRCHDDPPTVKSDFARANAAEVAMAASLGLITTKLHDPHLFTQFGNEWRLTTRGLHILEKADLDE